MQEAEAVFERYRGHEDDADAQDRLWAELADTVLSDPDVPFHEHWRLYQSVFADRRPEDGPPQAWRPRDDTIARANLNPFFEAAGVSEYPALHRWSVGDPEAFWGLAIERLGVPFQTGPERIMDISEGPESPRWFPGARMNAVEACFTAPEDRPALIFGKEGSDTTGTWTYAELKRRVDRVSHGLRDLGVAPGEAVALYMPMTAVCVAAYLGIVQAGCVVVSIPDSFAPAEVATRLRLGDARLVVTVDAFQRAGKPVPMYSKAVEAGAAHCIVIADEPEGLRDQDMLWKEFLGDDAPFEAEPCDPDATTNILFSSGTTGEPKAIPWTHLTPLKSAIDGHLHQDIHPDDVVAWPTNIGWMMGPWLIYASLANGATMALYEGAPTGDGFLSFLRDAKVSVLGLVPAIVRAWRGADVPPHSLPHVRVWSSTGEASNAEDYLYLMSLAGYRAPVIEYCGGTEIGGGHLTGTVVQPASPATFTTPALGIDFVLLDDAGRPVPEGGHGEIYLVPPSLGLSQRLLNKDHHETYYDGCPPGPDGRILRRHGDEVESLHGWWWRAQGRADDTMNLGGIKVGSVELETACNGHGDVVECAAVAIPPDGGGADRLVLFVVPSGSPEPEALKAELQARIKERLNPLFRIHDLVIVDKLPRTASNKVMRRELRAQYAQ